MSSRVRSGRCGAYAKACAIAVQVDDESPLVREWALWAVRNLCEGDEGAREAISALRATDVVQDRALERAGLDVRLDSLTGRPRAVPRWPTYDEMT